MYMIFGLALNYNGLVHIIGCIIGFGVYQGIYIYNFINYYTHVDNC